VGNLYSAIDPIAFRLGPLAIRWYSLAYVVGLSLACIRFRALRSGRNGVLSPKQQTTLMLYLTLAVVCGSRLGYVLIYRPDYYWHHPGRILALTEGGMSFHGGFASVVVALWWFSRREEIPFFLLADQASLIAPVALAWGRFGNFQNGELYGRQGALPWCVELGELGCRHPSQLYEALSEGLILALVLWWLRSRHPAPGVISWTFVCGYGSLRFVMEYFRAPDAHLGLLAGNLTMGQWLCLPMVVIGLVRCRQLARASQARPAVS